MFRFLTLPFLIVCFVFLQSCDTMYHLSSIKLEILVPSKLAMPQEYKKAAIRYNNSNISFNPILSFYFEDGEKITDTFNTDSIASEIYFNVFADHLKNQQYFDSVIEIESANYSKIAFSDSLIYLNNFRSEDDDSLGINNSTFIKREIMSLSKIVKQFSDYECDNCYTKYIDPEYGLYSKEDIQQIADTTGADLLISLDWFAAFDGIFSLKYTNELKDSLSTRKTKYRVFTSTANETVHILPYWNFYDLKKQDLIFSYRKNDTIKWEEPAYKLNQAKKVLPPREDAIYNAADIAGANFAEFLVPHWIEVDRFYYKSRNADMKKAEELMKQNQWLKAAEIWKSNAYNSNKKIAAKSMYNMAIACEVNGQMDAAIDWAVKSFYSRQNKDEFHSQNCQNYIWILGRRKLDIRTIEGNLINK